MHLENKVCQRDKVFVLMVDGDRHSRAVFSNELTCAHKRFVLSAFDIHLDESNSLSRENVIESNRLDLGNAFEVSLFCLFPADYAGGLKGISGETDLLM